jgi:hypothetical protein
MVVSLRRRAGLGLEKPAALNPKDGRINPGELEQNMDESELDGEGKVFQIGCASKLLISKIHDYEYDESGKE